MYSSILMLTLIIPSLKQGTFLFMPGSFCCCSDAAVETTFNNHSGAAAYMPNFRIFTDNKGKKSCKPLKKFSINKVPFKTTVNCVKDLSQTWYFDLCNGIHGWDSARERDTSEVMSFHLRLLHLCLQAVTCTPSTRTTAQS